ncbi:MAG TPA: PAS domain-containing protein [Magnetospirillaceae bacterium]
MSVGNIVLALLLFAFDQSNGQSNGLTRSGRIWAIAKLLEGLGFFGLGLRGEIPDWISIPIGNALLFGGFATEFFTAHVYLRLSRMWYAVLVLAAALIAVFLAGYAIGLPETDRIALFAAMSVIIFGATGIAHLTRWNSATILGRVFGLSYVLMGVIGIVRTVAAAMGPGFTLMSNAPPQTITFGPLALFMLFNGFSFLLLAQEDTGRKLMRNRERLTQARRIAKIASVEMDLTTGLPVWSSGLPELLGFASDQTPPDWESFRARIHPEDRPKVDDSVVASQRGRALEPDEYRILGGDGQWRWVRREAELLPSRGDVPSTILVTLQDITDRVRMEDELRQGYASLQRAQRMGKMGSVDVDLETMKVRWSDELYSIYGRDPKDGPADLDTFLQMIHPDDRHLVGSIRDQYTRDLRGAPDGTATEFRIVRSDGAVRWIHREVQQVRDDHGRPVALVTVEQDVTARVEMEDELRHSTERLVLAQRTGRIGSAEIDLQAGRTTRSAEYLRLLGIDPAKGSCSAEDVLEAFHPDDREKVGEGMRKAALGQDVPPVDLRILRHDGAIAWVKRHQQFVADAAGKQRLVIVTLQDITERVRIEDELRRSSERLVLAQRTGRIGSAEIDLRTGLGIRSDEFYRVLGLDPAAARADDRDVFIETLHPDDRDKLRIVIEKTARGEHVPPIDLRVIREDGKIVWVRRHHDFIVGASGARESAIITIQDITDQKMLEQAKDEFVSTVSHELRTPLTSIRGALALVTATMTVDVPEKVRHLIDVASRNSERLSRLVDDLLDVQRIAAGRMIYHIADVNLLPLVEDAIEANRPLGAKHGIELRLVDTLPGVRVRADAERLMQVMANLLSNAVKFSKAGQVVEVSMQRRSPWVRITVEDHGEGIPSAFHNKMFKPFSQSDSSDTRRKGGSGLGLSIVEAIVTHHQGHISFETEMGQGTRFHIDLKELDSGANDASAAA